jgi:hypothetical protein
MAVIYLTDLGSSYFATFYAGDHIESIPVKFLFFAILVCTSIITPEIDLSEKFLKRSTKMDKKFERCKDVKNKSVEDHGKKCRQGKSGAVQAIKCGPLNPRFKNIFD